MGGDRRTGLGRRIVSPLLPRPAAGRRIARRRSRRCSSAARIALVRARIGASVSLHRPRHDGENAGATARARSAPARSVRLRRRRKSTPRNRTVARAMAHSRAAVTPFGSRRGRHDGDDVGRAERARAREWIRLRSRRCQRIRLRLHGALDGILRAFGTPSANAVLMRHSATNTERDHRTSPGRSTESRRAGIRSLDCGHELSHDRDLARRRAEDTDDPHQSPEAASDFGEQRQAV
jgi:hypothetical protein